MIDAAYQEFMAAEKARTAAEQERRQQSLSERVTAEDIVAVEQLQIAEQPDEVDEYDPWMDQLKNVEQRAGVLRVYSRDGVCELRISTRYVLTAVLGVEPTRSDWALASQRLVPLMRRLGWSGAKEMRFGRHKAHGYYRLEEERK